MRRRAACIALVLLAIGAGACGGDGAEEAADSWLAAVEEERWDQACAAIVDAEPDCEARLRKSYAGRDLKLLGEGEYLQGDEENDNETRFAFVATGADMPQSTTAFEVVEGDRIRLVVSVEAGGAG